MLLLPHVFSIITFALLHYSHTLHYSIPLSLLHYSQYILLLVKLYRHNTTAGYPHNTITTTAAHIARAAAGAA